MNWLALGIRMIHICFILWMIWVPFTNNETMLMMHAIISPFLMLHWIFNSDGCALTLLEKHVRGLDHDNESFIHSIVSPIYKIDDATLRPIVFGLTMGLWYITLSRLKYKNQKQVKRTNLRE